MLTPTDFSVYDPTDLEHVGWYYIPVHLDELEPSAYAEKLVEYLGDTDKVLEMAKEDYEKGEYQWVAQITNTLVYADPENVEWLQEGMHIPMREILKNTFHKEVGKERGDEPSAA